MNSNSLLCSYMFVILDDVKVKTSVLALKTCF